MSHYNLAQFTLYKAGQVGQADVLAAEAELLEAEVQRVRDADTFGDARY